MSMHAEAIEQGAEMQSFDTQKSEKFAERMLGVFNDAALTLMVSIGHRTGLFDIFAELEWVSSSRLASVAKLDERYVREWLGAMTTGGVVLHDPENGTYQLPKEHSAWLTRTASPNNLAVTAQWIPLLARAEDKIVERFEHGGGTQYHDYCGFHHVMAEESSQTAVAPLFDSILPLVPGLEMQLARGIDVLDAGCGSGRALQAMAQRFPQSRFTGYDLCADALDGALRESDRLGLKNIHFEQRDLTAYDEPGRFDFITTFDAVHDQKDPSGMLRGLARALKPGGVYLMQDIGGSSVLSRNVDHAMGTFLYTISCMHCMAVSLGQGGAGLGAMWGVELAEQMLGEAGFVKIEQHRLPHDPINVYFVSRRA
ncbi:2-polyprenyl-3-methyl-5-hydroxy-6-metoxy-1,4-benzoquinol methylase [Rhodoligotrophos appendicifer]|uniref:class I SAM-dependent methyltransferase n=1 Tax=Rhodoligotrophos appendicifer TaxID=987056 RepID=UPI001FE8B453|nr:class I SAM-dependent methyltransferase [Rhodoligotrophos appendicifer]